MRAARARRPGRQPGVPRKAQKSPASAGWPPAELTAANGGRVDACQSSQANENLIKITWTKYHLIIFINACRASTVITTLWSLLGAQPAPPARHAATSSRSVGRGARKY